MFFDVHEMALGKVRFNETFQPGAIEFFDLQLRQVTPIQSSGLAELSDSTSEIRIGGHLTTVMEVACDRCLETARIRLDSDFDLLYRPSTLVPEATELEVHDEESEVGFYEGDGLELADVLREEILLLLPMQRVCREGCRGICPVCGHNRNLVDCHCQAEPPDDRWSALRDL